MRHVGFYLLLALVLDGCGHGGDADEEAGIPAVVGARTGIATVQPFTAVVTAIGTVIARPGHVAALSAPGPTRVARVDVVVGQAVQAGDSLLAFERAPFDAAAQSAEAAYIGAQHTAERAERLAKAGVLSQKELEQSQTELAQARLNVVTARRALELATLRAPIAGVVTAMDAVLGASVESNQMLVQIADPLALDALLIASLPDAPGIRPGASVTLSAEEGGAGDAPATGVVTDVGGAVDADSRGVPVRVRIGRRGQLRVGETVFGTIAIGDRAKAVTVPVEALVPQGEGYTVFVVDDSSIAHAREVTVGGRNAGVAEITDGLVGGERIVTYGAYGVADSARIVPPKP